jgi:hypothetical protein
MISRITPRMIMIGFKVLEGGKFGAASRGLMDG